MNIDNANEKIKNIKYPYFFLFHLLTYKIEIGDYYFSLILRLFLKNHIDIALNTNLKKFFYNDILDFKISTEILEKFYKLLNTKLILILTLKKWHNIYNNSLFWELNINNKIDYILNLKFKFLAIYDCSKNGTPFHLKLSCLFKPNNPSRFEIMENIKERLLLIIKLFSLKILESLNIPLIKISDFYNLDSRYLIEYLTLIFNKIIKLLDETLLLLENYNMICNNINNLLNPKEINIIDSYNIYDDYNINDIIKY